MPTARLIEAPATLYAEPDYNKAVMDLPVGNELELGAVKNAGGLQWVSVVLPDGRRGFVPGDTKVFTKKSATLVQDEATVRSAPALSSAAVITYRKNARFSLIDQVPGEGGNWVKVRDSAGNEGFIGGQTRVKTTAGSPKELGLKQMRTGGLWCLGGIAITTVTYSMASDGGGTYLVMWGPMLWGAWTFLKGFFNYVKE